MPLSELIRYFNVADADGDSTLYPADGQVAAWHRGWHLASRFAPIVDLHHERIVGHQASLLVRAADGREAAAAAVYADCPTPEAVVHLDRLCRTLHALNFLGQRRHAGGYLQVAVHRRHLQAVPNQHGLVYEAILKRCGLAPADIVLHIEATADGLLNEALTAYRQRGYRLALGGTLPAAGTLAALAPDIVQIGATAPAEWFAAARAAGALVERCGIDDGRHYQAARDAGCDLGQGALFGLPAADCRATHEQRRLAYNAPLHNGATP